MLFNLYNSVNFSVQLPSCVQLLMTPWTAAHQASLSIIYSWSLLKFTSIKSVVPSNHLILCHLLSSLYQFSSVALLCPTVCNSMDCSTLGSPVHHQFPGACSNSCPSSQWCHQIITSSVVPFSSCLQSFPTSGSFPVSQFFSLGGQSIGVSASTSVLPMNIQDWFRLGCIGWISLQSKGLSRVFSNTTVQKHQFFGAQLSLWSNSHIHTWLLENP